MEGKWKSRTKNFSIEAGIGRKDVEDGIIRDVNNFINNFRDNDKRNAKKSWFREPREKHTIITCIVDYEEFEKSN